MDGESPASHQPSTLNHHPSTIPHQFPTNHHEPTQARTLAQHFTPEPVVDLCYRMLRILDPSTVNPCIIDPACGEGAFLLHALEYHITSPDCLFGIDKDPSMAERWAKSGLNSRAHLHIGDGLSSSLDPPPCIVPGHESFQIASGKEKFPLHREGGEGQGEGAEAAHTPGCPHPVPFPSRDVRHYGRGLYPASTPQPCTLATTSPGDLNAPWGAFDWVVGNPPFGTGVIDASLADSLDSRFTIHRRDGRGTDFTRYPIEILFLERFVQLAKPGGCIAIIIPDGILANARLAYVREWLHRHLEVKAVVSLPQSTFHRTGAAAKSSVLLLRKRVLPDQDEPDRPIFMAALESRKSILEGTDGLASVFSDGMDAHSSVESPPWLVFAVQDTARDARLDPAYHHPKYKENERFLSSLSNVVTLGELIEYTTYGQVGAREFSDTGVRLLTPANFAMTEDGLVCGIDLHSPERFVRAGLRNDPRRSRLRKGDLLLTNSGVGCIGRAAVFYSDEPCNISQHVNLIRTRGIEPEYLAVYLQTQFARLQIHREKCGVGACGINFDRIKSILVPLVSDEQRVKIARDYRAVMTAQLLDAQRMIHTLVKSFEELISGY